MLNGTPSAPVERSALRINPAKTCQPIGAMYAALGIHGCMPHSHGSQGCCAYHRSHLTRHFKEPVMATTSSFTEGASVFGGMPNLTQGLRNIFSIYNPDVVAVHTTCLSEVIGDDIPTIFRRAREEGCIPEGKVVLHANTPSFVGSHVYGFANMVAAMVTYLSESSGTPKNQINVIPGFVEPADMREIKRLANLMGVPTVMFPDTSNVLDGPLTGEYSMFPKGGTTVPELRSTGDSIATLCLGTVASQQAGITLENKCNVPSATLDLPIGVGATDKFINALRSYGSGAVPEELETERGRLVDMMSDLQQYFHRKRVALFGDPDHVVALTQFLLELGALPVYAVTGSPGAYFEKRLHEILDPVVPDAKIKTSGDLFELHQWIKAEPVDLLLGNTYGKQIARAENNLPFVRFGFPILDRAGHRFFPSVGYAGSIRLLDQMLNALFDKRDRECAEEWFELVL